MDKELQKGNEFKGVFAGAGYKNLAALFGFTEKFYNKAIDNIKATVPVKVLDLGCGPGSLSYSLSVRINPESEIVGIDISEDQLKYARLNSKQYPCNIQFINRSMDDLKFENNSFDIVMTSMALHETPPAVRRRAIMEVSRVLKPDGIFVLIDWSKPRFGLWGIIWFPTLLNRSGKDNWNNTYKKLCENEGLVLTDDCYLNSLVRRQVFKKNPVGVSL